MGEAREGTPSWNIKSAGARMSEKEGLILFARPQVTFYEVKRFSSRITADSGELKTAGRDAVLTGTVKINSERDGMKLATSKLFYSSARGKVWTDAPVTIHRGKTVIAGMGFTANPDLSEIEIKRQETRLLP